MERQQSIDHLPEPTIAGSSRHGAVPFPRRGRPHQFQRKPIRATGILSLVKIRPYVCAALAAGPGRQSGAQCRIACMDQETMSAFPQKRTGSARMMCWSSPGLIAWRDLRAICSTCSRPSPSGMPAFGHCGTPVADPTTPHGRLMLTVLRGLAKFERELIRSRTSEGRERAKARGVVMDRK
jgi:hypothetical protein